MKPGDLVRLVRKITPYEAPRVEENSDLLWYTIHPGEVGMFVQCEGEIIGLFLFSRARVMANMEMFEVVQ